MCILDYFCQSVYLIFKADFQQTKILKIKLNFRCRHNPFPINNNNNNNNNNTTFV